MRLVLRGSSEEGPSRSSRPAAAEINFAGPIAEVVRASRAPEELLELNDMQLGVVPELASRPPIHLRGLHELILPLELDQ